MFTKIVRAMPLSSIKRQDLYSIVKSFNGVISDIASHYSFASGRFKS